MKTLEKDNERNRLIMEYLPYVKRIVNRMAIHLPPNIELEDLVNAGVIGLISAAERFDPSRENKFISYASFRIKGAVLSELRSRDYHSRSSRKKIRELEKMSQALERKLGREVEPEEAARELNLDLDEFYEIKRMASISFVSFEELGYPLKKEKNSIVKSLVNNELPDAFQLTRLKEIGSALAKTIDKLPKKERLVVSLYYWEEMTMKEIGKVLEISESRVSQIHSKAVIHLRGRLTRQGLLDV